MARPIRIGALATKTVFGIPDPLLSFVMPAWMPNAQLIKLRFRPDDIATAVIRESGKVRGFTIDHEHYYLTIGFEIARNERT